MALQVVRTYVLGYALFAMPLCVMVVDMDRFVLHASLNSAHSAYLDLVFKYGTHLADTGVPVLVALLFLLKDLRSFLMVGVSAGLSALVVQVIKHGFAVDQLRPSMYLDRMAGLPMVEGVELLQHNSFPSGHATAAFSTCFALAVIVGRPLPGFLLALLAGAIGFSRIYLSQHFALDVLVGATIGTFTACAVWYWLYASPLSERRWLHRSITGRTARSEG